MAYIWPMTEREIELLLADQERRNRALVLELARTAAAHGYGRPRIRVKAWRRSNEDKPDFDVICARAQALYLAPALRVVREWMR